MDAKKLFEGLSKLVTLNTYTQVTGNYDESVCERFSLVVSGRWYKAITVINGEEKMIYDEFNHNTPVEKLCQTVTRLLANNK